MHKLTRPLALVALLACSAPAQTTWIIDGSGSGDFTDLPQAVLAASAGDVLQMRPGTYTPASISTGLRILGGPGVLVSSGSFDIQGVPSGETLVLSGIRSAEASTVVSISIAQCDGMVQLESIGTHQPPGSTGPISLQIDSSRSVSAIACQFGGSSSHGIVVSGSASQLTLSDCDTVGGRVDYQQYYSTHGRDALRVTGGRVHISNCEFWGGSGTGPRGSGGNGVTLYGGECWIGPGTVMMFGFGGTGFFGGGNGSQISISIAGARARIDPQVYLAYVSSPMEIAPVPSVRLSDVSPGSALAPVCSGAAGEPMALLVGLAATSAPSPWGPLFIDPTTSAAIYFGPFVEHPATLQLLPSLPIGTAVAVQGIVAFPGELVLTNPAIRVLR